PQQRAAGKETWKLARLQELAESTPIDPSVRELPPSPEEVAAAERAKYEEKQQKSTSYQQQVADIAERGKEANATRDRGEGISEEKRAYREALQRAEDAALYGEFAEVKSGYGDNAVQPKATSEQLDEFGGAFPGYENA